MSNEQPEAVWRMAECDEQQWREMGCPTMGTALKRIVELKARVVFLDAHIRDLEAELIATPLPATNSRLRARNGKRAVR